MGFLLEARPVFLMTVSIRNPTQIPHTPYQISMTYHVATFFSQTQLPNIDAIPDSIEAQVEFALNAIKHLAKDRGDVIAKGLGCY